MILLLILSSVAIYIPSVSINLIQIEWVLSNLAFPWVGHILCLSGKLTLMEHQAVTALRASYHLCKIAPFIYVAHLTKSSWYLLLNLFMPVVFATIITKLVSKLMRNNLFFRKTVKASFLKINIG